MTRVGVTRARGPLDVPAGDADAGETTLSGLRRLRYDVGDRPFLVLFELTRACELALALPGRSETGTRNADELTSDEVAAVLDDLAALDHRDRSSCPPAATR